MVLYLVCFRILNHQISHVFVFINNNISIFHT